MQKIILLPKIIPFGEWVGKGIRVVRGWEGILSGTRSRLPCMPKGTSSGCSFGICGNAAVLNSAFAIALPH